MSILGIAQSSIAASEAAMDITASNIANADTPYYVRKSAVLVATQSGTQGSYGVNAKDIARIYSQTNMHNLNVANSNLANSTTRLEKSRYLETLTVNDDTGIGRSFNKLFASINAVNVRPSSSGSRQNCLSDMNFIVNRFNNVAKELDAEQNNLNQEIKDEISLINQAVSTLAQLNKNINTNDNYLLGPMLDQQDELIDKLSKYLGPLTIFHNSNNSVNIQLSNGTSLLDKDNAFTLQTIPSVSMANQLDVTIDIGGYSTIVTNIISTGELQGLLDYQNDILMPAQNGLNRLALAFMQSINNQNVLGIDANAAPGVNIFVDLNSATQGFGGRAFNYTSNSSNTDASVTILDATALTLDNYTLTYTAVAGNQASYSITSDLDGSELTAGTIDTTSTSTINTTAFKIDISSFAGTVTVGDAIKIIPAFSAAKSMSINITDANKLAVAQPISLSEAQTNTGAGLMSLTAITNNNSFASGALSPPYKLVFVSSSSFQLLNLNDNSVIATGAYNANGTDIFASTGVSTGYSVELSGAVNAGDAFDITYNSQGVGGDNRNGLSIANLLQTNLLDNGTNTFSAAYDAMAFTVALDVHSAKVSFETNTVLQNQAMLIQDQTSGVSLPEETVKLTKYQQSYEASAKLLEVSQRIFDVLMHILR
jgi:flagellar hook-associated protein 1